AVTGLVLARGRASIQLMVTVAIVVCLSVTVLPVGPLIALELILVQGTLAFTYHQTREAPAVFLGSVGLGLVAITVDPFDRLLFKGIALSTLVIALAAFAQCDRDSRARLGIGGLMAGLMLSLFSAPVLAWGSIFGGLISAATATAGWRSRRHIETV